MRGKREAQQSDLLGFLHYWFELSSGMHSILSNFNLIFSLPFFNNSSTSVLSCFSKSDNISESVFAFIIEKVSSPVILGISEDGR